MKTILRVPTPNGDVDVEVEINESECGPQVLYNNWENWIRDCYECGLNHKKLVLGPREYLKHYLTY